MFVNGFLTGIRMHSFRSQLAFHDRDIAPVFWRIQCPYLRQSGLSNQVCGCEELIVEGENGFLVGRDVDEMREKLELLSANRAALRQMGASNRELVVENWDWAQRAGG